MSVYRTIGPLVFEVFQKRVIEVFQKRVILKKAVVERWCKDSNISQYRVNVALSKYVVLIVLDNVL